LYGRVLDCQPAHGCGGLRPEVRVRSRARGAIRQVSLESKHLGVSLQRIAPDEVSPFAHRHGQQAEELYVVLAGNGRVKLDDEYRDIAEWDVVRVEGSILRSFEAGSEGLELLAFGEIHPQDAEIVTPDAAS